MIQKCPKRLRRNPKPNRNMNKSVLFDLHSLSSFALFRVAKLSSSLMPARLVLSFRKRPAPSEKHRHRETAKHGDPTHRPPSTLPTIREYPSVPSPISLSLPVPLSAALDSSSVLAPILYPVLLATAKKSEHPSARSLSASLAPSLAHPPPLGPALSVGWRVEGCGF